MASGDEAPRPSTGPASARMRRLEAVIRGRVQGVGFRVFIAREAERLGLMGMVANESGGRVRCVAEGPEDALLRLLVKLHEGPPAASVDGVQEMWGPAVGLDGGFHIVSRWHAGD